MLLDMNCATIFTNKVINRRRVDLAAGFDKPANARSTIPQPKRGIITLLSLVASIPCQVASVLLRSPPVPVETPYYK